jgi:CheY-like chemotaxis protein
MGFKPGFILSRHQDRRIVMKESVLTGKRILAVDDKPEVLTVLEKEISGSCPECRFETATTYREAVEKMMSWTYDVVLLDGMGTRDFDLLDWALVRNFPVAILTTTSPNPEPLNQAIKRATRFYLPKEKLEEIVPFLEDVVWYECSPWWERLLADHIGSAGMKKLTNILSAIFSHLPFAKWKTKNLPLTSLLIGPEPWRCRAARSVDCGHIGNLIRDKT